MATEAQIQKAKKTPKFKTRKRNRCFECGRARDFRRKFRLCGRDVRRWVCNGWIPGFAKISW
ncbi:type Z 30S ribosomal protein S14 [endosymbiont GvMRE of Glomus versiforme]|uniref:type Z 30S ribosomal protein S14 n=1 Tax=endosymbiont GvMRE of Glomus versiforme TaxID=2039283 RepID=UPI000EC48E00|nr:type Z 30S ribosomal protein S14 [endosymbiont GvMRE of Glomus versiforme]RHZ36266.1 30S ribosomal protein S14 type Z [endosymbiont GvMRE of Glomus versiforme]